MAKSDIKPAARLREQKRLQLQMEARHRQHLKERLELDMAEKRAVALLKVGFVVAFAAAVGLGVVVGWWLWG